jgi:hypothetical protein
MLGVSMGQLIALIQGSVKVTNMAIQERQGRLGFIANTGTHTGSME